MDSLLPPERPGGDHRILVQAVGLPEPGHTNNPS